MKRVLVTLAALALLIALPIRITMAGDLKSLRKIFEQAVRRTSDQGKTAKRPPHHSEDEGEPLTDLPIVDRSEGLSGLYVPSTEVEFGGQTYVDTLRFGNFGYNPIGAYVEYNLGRRYSRFTVTVGVNDSENYTLKYGVFGDGRELFRTQVLKAGDEPVPINLNVKGVLRLRLAIRGNGVPDGLEPKLLSYWVNPRVYRGGAEPPQTMAGILLDGNRIPEVAPIVRGEPCIPISVLQNLKSPIQRIDWNEEQSEVRISTRPEPTPSTVKRPGRRPNPLSSH